MTKAKYSYSFFEQDGYQGIAIGDRGIDDTSVTNDIEGVVAEIEKVESVDAKKFIVVYRDSDDIWDGWDAITQKFVILCCSTRKSAVDDYISYKKPKKYALTRILGSQK